MYSISYIPYTFAMPEIVMKRSIKKITVTFLIVKCIQYILVYLTPTQFDTSTRLFLAKYQSSYNLKWYHKLLSWDSVYFIKIAIHAIENENFDTRLVNPEFEHEWVFSPFAWAAALRYMKAPGLKQLDALIDSLLWRGCILNLVLHYVSVWILYALTLQTFPKNHDLALKTALLFIISSAAGFLIAPYSEPTSFTLSFTGMLLREYALDYNVYGLIALKKNRWVPYLLSSLMFSLATVNRSNCIILGIYYLCDLFKLLRQRNYLVAFWFPIMAGLLMLTTFFYNHYLLPYKAFCSQDSQWCSENRFGIPFPTNLFYSYLQAKYWNVGFLNYWSVNNIPNFIIALPNIVLIWYSTIYFSYQYPLESLRPLVYITRVFLLILVVFVHVQIVNRVFSFIPLHLWYLSDRLIKTKGDAKGDDKLVYYYVHWLIFWVPLQTVLFAAFLPPA
ncbi:HER005Cp [Eremothecium sinecaudum]|uniref:GPI mannosyltransferase 2 n=1 Tax=Eremothecium sinecaudum TaxID=45286 RepID=A0A0X8HTN9_9SACH|nr:HER005Cp [Eremothecium sinecaudum]AMD21284.1 HER005Cp [Eremothecium sinecaudum]